MVNKNIFIMVIFIFMAVGCSSTATSIKKAQPNVIDPVCAYFSDMGCIHIAVCEDTPKSTYEDVTYYFCSAECKQDFDKNPSKYLKAVSLPEEATDPVCHTKIVERRRFATCIYQNNTYCFCSDHCRTEFMVSPDRYSKKEVCTE